MTVKTASSSKNFARFKTDMVRELYMLFNSTVFSNEVLEFVYESPNILTDKLSLCVIETCFSLSPSQLPANMEISWNKKLRTTAGYCYNSGYELMTHWIAQSTVS